MWLFLNDSALSVVQHRDMPARLLVRARVPGDIEAVFPQAEVSETPEADYRYRAAIPRERVAAAIAERLAGIDYDNFKGSVRSPERELAYLDVWDEWRAAAQAWHAAPEL